MPTSLLWLLVVVATLVTAQGSPIGTRLDTTTFPSLQRSSLQNHGTHAMTSHASNSLEHTYESRKVCLSGHDCNEDLSSVVTLAETALHVASMTRKTQNTLPFAPTHLDSSAGLDRSLISRATVSKDNISQRAALSEIVIALNSSTTASSFATDLCDSPSFSTLTSLRITAPSATFALYFELPPCLVNASSLVTISGQNLLIPSFDAIPSTILSLSCVNCKFGPLGTTPSATARSSSTTNTLGFDSDGNFVWPDFWTYFSQVDDINFHSCNIRGLLPDSIPRRIFTFAIYDNQLPLGNIPSTLFSDYAYVSWASSLQFIFSNCGLNGTLPPGLLSPFMGTMIPNGFTLSLPVNSLSGAIPPTLFSPLSSAQTSSFNLNFFSNKLEGSLPTNLFPNGLVQSSAVIELDLSYNRFSGVLPNGLLSLANGTGYLSFNAAHNDFSGQLPDTLFSDRAWSAQSDLRLDLSSNSLSGTIPTTLLGSANASFSNLILVLNHNALTGSLPRRFCNTTNCAISALICLFDVSYNQLTGSVPEDLFARNPPPFNHFMFLILFNALSGQFPPNLASISSGFLTVNAVNNRFTGNPPVECDHLAIAEYDFQNNQLDGTIPLPSNATLCQQLTLGLDDNPKLSGSIPPELFNLKYIILRAARTNLTGLIPPVITSRASVIDLSNTAIDFCSRPLNDNSTSSLFVPSRCLLAETSAACNCPQLYGSCVLTCVNPPPSVLGLNLPPTSAAPSGCDPKTRPGPEFTCFNGVWTATSTSRPVLTIPSGAGVVIVEGNVSSSTIVINGIGSKIIVGGCLSNLSSLVIELSPGEVKRLGSTQSLQTLLTLSNRTESCSIDLNNVTLTTKTSGCRKVSTEKVLSYDGNTLSALFTVSSRGCNTWWIILVSVLSAVVLVGVAVVAVVYVLWNRHQVKRCSTRLERSQPRATEA